MPELRRDIISGKWSIVAVNRSMRPESFTEARPGKVGRQISDCPFCSGNELQTPPELDAFRDDQSKPNSRGWNVRVVPNKYPAFTLDEVDDDNENFYQHHSALGLHEVIIHNPVHDLSLGTMEVAGVTDVVKMYKRRYISALKNSKVQSITIIVNHGREAGASIEHSHSQLFAIPQVPALLKSESNRLRAYYEKNGECLFCKVVKYEMKAAKRIVAENNRFIAFCPYASQTPFAIWLAPKAHFEAFELSDEATLNDFASILHSVLATINNKLHNPPYNYWLHSRPRGVENFHWHLEIAPKLAIQAGF
ncbi:MAG TPA: DUF4921 family protein, partial [Actinobacteria bacterium]|nr:DUF4921 family protein [Actinomycetes bacterium]HEX21216.1 DUF4921 family protein [Actinomycetota bacterium]